MNKNGSSVVEISKANAERDLKGLDAGVSAHPDMLALGYGAEQELLDGSEEAILNAVDDSIKETLAHEMKGYRAWKTQQDAAKA